jgi:hypothetical protein
LIARGMPKNSFFTITERIFENTYILRKRKRKIFLFLNFLKSKLQKGYLKILIYYGRGKEKMFPLS